MKLYSLSTGQILPITIYEAWNFFSNPRKLETITPRWLNFEVTSELPEQMYPGMIIAYRIRPVAGMSVKWVTEITHVHEPYHFVDEQRFGPYRFWHHQHFFREVKDGTEMRDLVHYALPWGPVGRFTHSLLVGKKLNEIFSYRRHCLERTFGQAQAVRISA